MAKDPHGYTKSGQALQTQHANSPGNALAVQKAYLEARIPQIQQWVRMGVRPEALVRFTLMEMSTNSRLRESTPQSIYLGLLACAVTGLEPGTLKGEAFLVPFRNKGIMEATFIPGWKGLVKSARRSREIIGITANVVRERDVFDLDLGTANSLIHKPARGDRGDVIGAYAIANLEHGHRELEWMDIEDLIAIRKVAEKFGEKPAWAEWEDQMQRKSVLRRLCKRLPLGSDYFVALELEKAADEGRPQLPIIDLETDGAATASQAAPVIDVAEPAPEMPGEFAFDPEAVKS